MAISDHGALVTKKAVWGLAFYKAAICGGYVMASGVHYAEFTRTGEYGLVGVARGGFEVAAGELPSNSAAGWAYDMYDGVLRHGGGGSAWAGQEGCPSGATVGLRLDLTAGTLEVFRDGRRLGVMAEGLAGPLCWHAELMYAGDVVRIQGKPPPAL